MPLIQTAANGDSYGMKTKTAMYYAGRKRLYFNTRKWAAEMI